MKKLYKNNKFKMTAFTLNEKFELPDWSHSVSDIQEVFEYIIKKQEMFADNIYIYIYYIYNEITFFLFRL